jgi:hypothetical protein
LFAPSPSPRQKSISSQKHAARYPEVWIQHEYRQFIADPDINGEPKDFSSDKQKETKNACSGRIKNPRDRVLK